MRTMVIALLVVGILGATACGHGSARKASDISAVGIFGGAVVNVSPVACAGRIILSGGAAEVKDACFTGETNVVVCSDATSISPVRCAPHAGALSIGGSGNDVIAYARMR